MAKAITRPDLRKDSNALARIFHEPESDQSRLVLSKYMEQILFDLHNFLQEHVGIKKEISLETLASRFTSSDIAKDPDKNLADVISALIEDIAPHAVNVSSPHFIGHMTSAIPSFMIHLNTIVSALNQNVVKVETSKVVSLYERQVLAKIHRLLFKLDRTFYDTNVQKPESTLGCFVEDGTLANLTALWVARNQLFPPAPGYAGVEKDGLAAAMQDRGIRRVVVLVSELAHYSLRKAAGVLGLGNGAVVPIAVDRTNRIDMNELKSTLEAFGRDSQTAVAAVVGIAGTTETGSVDPLSAIADVCQQNNIYFHVDAAWGGPVLMSERYGGLLDGIERADSVTLDGHKQFYLPMSNGMVYFRDPRALDVVAYNATYILRHGSMDLGARSIVGSRSATSLVLGSALEIMGTEGYALLIDHGIKTARLFAEEIRRRPTFELVTPPELNIVTYRMVTDEWKASNYSGDGVAEDVHSHILNHINVRVQKRQRETGNSFVSRTTLKRSGRPDTVVLRAVIMNPQTTPDILRSILDEQETIYREHITPSLPN